MALTAKLSEVISDEIIGSFMGVAVDTYLLEIEIVLDAEVWHFDAMLSLVVVAGCCSCFLLLLVALP